MDTCDVRASFEKFAPLAKTNPGKLKLPRFTERCFKQIGRNMAHSLPSGILSVREIWLLFGDLERPPNACPKPHRRKSIVEITDLPPLWKGNRQYLDLDNMTKVSHRCAFGLLQNVLGERLFHNTDENPLGIRAQWLLLHAVSRTLARAYSEGLRSVIAKFVHSWVDGPRNLDQTEPWFLLRREGVELVEVRFVWAKVRALTD